MNNSGDKILLSGLPLGKHFSILTKLYFGALTKRLEHLDLERYFSILILAEKNASNCTQQFLSNQLKIDKASMVRIIDYLVKKKYLKRTVNANDRRERRIELTAKAKQVLPELHKGVAEMNKTAMKGLNQKQVKDFNFTFNILFENLSKEPSSRIIVNYKKAKASTK